MPLHSTDYQHWQGQRRGIWYRRAVITGNGLKGCFQSKWVRRLSIVCWSGALAQAALLFLVGQLLVSDSLIVRNLDKLNPQLRNIVQGFTTWLEMHPEVSVRSTENFLFYHFSRFYLPLAMFALALAIPHLITRDIASNALTIYASKAVARFDYLLGKFGTVFGLLIITWLGPVCFVWLLGNLLAPHWHFFWHSRFALGHALVFVISSISILSLLALGVSAISGREKVPVGLWIGWWLMSRFVANHALEAQSASDGNSARLWLEHLSVTFNLDQISAATFRLMNDLKLAQENVPLFSTVVRDLKPNMLASWQNPDLSGALIALGLMVIAAAIIISRRVKPE
jgi:ABC-2 type transport system permease protein